MGGRPGVTSAPGRSILWVGICCVLQTGIGCATPSSGKTLEALQASVTGYLEAFRWKNYSVAARYLPAADRTAFLSTFDEDGNAIHVEDAKVVQVDLQSDEAAEITVRYRYMKLPSVTVERSIVTQSWHKVDGRWILEYEDPPLVELDPSPSREADSRPTPESGEPGDTRVDVETPWQR